MLTRHLVTLILGVLAHGIVSTPATAQVRSGTSGVFIGAALNGSAIKADDLDSDTENGGGLTLQLGYGFTPKFALFFEGAGAAMDSEGPWTLAHFDFGARYHFANSSRALVPFLEAAFSGRAGRGDDAVFYDENGNPQTGRMEITGGGFTVGGGLLYFFNPKLALNTQLKLTTGEFTTVKFRNVSIDGFEIDATSTRFNIGISWFPVGTKR